MPLLLLGGVGGIDEEAHAHGVPSLLFQEGQQGWDGIAIVVKVLCTLFFVGGQERDVAAREFLGGGSEGECREQRRQEVMECFHFGLYFVLLTKLQFFGQSAKHLSFIIHKYGCASQYHVVPRPVAIQFPTGAFP